MCVSGFEKYYTGSDILYLCPILIYITKLVLLIICPNLYCVCFPQIVGCAISLYILSPKLTGLLIVVVPYIIGVGTFIGSLLRTLSKNAQIQVIVMWYMF